MKRIAYVFFLTEVVLAGMLVAVSGAQSSLWVTTPVPSARGQDCRVGQEVRQRQFAQFRPHQRCGNMRLTRPARRRQPGAEAKLRQAGEGVTPSAPSQDATKKTDPNDAWKQKIADQQGRLTCSRVNWM